MEGHYGSNRDFVGKLQNLLPKREELKSEIKLRSVKWEWECSFVEM